MDKFVIFYKNAGKHLDAPLCVCYNILGMRTQLRTNTVW